MSDHAPFPYLDADAVTQRLSMASAIRAMRAAFADDTENPPRVRLADLLFMPARVGPYTGIKVVCTRPGSPVGTVSLYGPDGTPLGMLDGATLTQIRTGAASGLATDLLAAEHAETLTMLGAGSVSMHQVEAVLTVRRVRRVRVWSRDPLRADALAGAIAERHPALFVETDISADAAVAEANIICCATPATTPLFSPDAVRPGTHINAVGAFTPDMAEVPPATVHAARVVVDDRAAAAREAGDLLQAGRVPDASLADLLGGRLAARERPDQITLFKSVGVAAQDVAAAVAALSGTAALDTPTPPRDTARPQNAAQQSI